MQEQQTKNPYIIDSAYSELQEKYFKLAWRIERNKKGLSKPLYDLMYQNLLTEFNRDYKIYNGTEGLKLDMKIKELEIIRATAIKRVELKMEEIMPKKVRRGLFWRKRPNYALQLVQDEAEADIDKYFDDRENELKLLQESIGGKPDKEVPADKVEQITAMLENIFPAPHGRKRRKKHAEQLRELAEDIYIVKLTEQTKPAEEAPAEAEQEKKTRKRIPKQKQRTEPEQITLIPEPAEAEQGDEQKQEEAGTPDPRGGVPL